MQKIDTPRLSEAMKSGDKSTVQLLEIAANEIASGDLRDLIVGTARLLEKTKEKLNLALAIR